LQAKRDFAHWVARIRQEDSTTTMSGGILGASVSSSRTRRGMTHSRGTPYRAHARARARRARVRRSPLGCASPGCVSIARTPSPVALTRSWAEREITGVVGQFGRGSPKPGRLTSRMQGRLKRRTLNELADRDRHSNWNDLWHISAGVPCFCSLDDPPPITGLMLHWPTYSTGQPDWRGPG
jgi:hypothetical protein